MAMNTQTIPLNEPAEVKALAAELHDAEVLVTSIQFDATLRTFTVLGQRFAPVVSGRNVTPKSPHAQRSCFRCTLRNVERIERIPNPSGRTDGVFTIGSVLPVKEDYGIELLTHDGDDFKVFGHSIMAEIDTESGDESEPPSATRD